MIYWKRPAMPHSPKEITGSTRGIRCPAKNGKWWCSRDAGHYGAHESRSDDGPGLIGWWNAEYVRPEREV